MNTHWIDREYLTIRNDTGQYSLKLDGKTARDAAMEAILEMEEKEARIARRLRAMRQFLDHETTTDPKALTF